MAPFSVSTLKEKATQVKSASIKSYDSARERISANSTSASSTKAKPPPPPPRRVSSNKASEDPGRITDVETIDWANLSDDDKQVFFAWLDEFFARYFGANPPPTVTVPTATGTLGATSAPVPHSPPPPPPPRAGSRTTQYTGLEPTDEPAPAKAPSPPRRRSVPPPPSQRGPPKINYSTKPSAPSEEPAPPLPNASARPSHSSDPTDLQMSFPPPTANGSAAADLAVFMHPSTPWDTDWYTGDPPMPPHLNGSPEIRFAGSFGHLDARGVVFFSDLSMCWYSVTYGKGSVTRWARFRPCPEPMSGDALRRAAEIHGAAVSAFAERAAASGRPVARGECWDVAHEALRHAGSLVGSHDAPILSTSRTHGHLLFFGKPGVGRWRGGDDRLRAGDIVEWRSVRIGTRQYGGFAILGQPDHTAVIVEDTIPRCAVGDGQSVKPADVGILTVVEQTAGHVPKRESYDLAKLQQGEVWVYRPVGMIEYLGSTLSIDIPSGLEVFAI